MTDSGVVEQLQELKRKEEGAQRLRARREADLELATNARDGALEALSTEFGVGTVEEAEAELARRESAFREEVGRVVEALKGVS